MFLGKTFYHYNRLMVTHNWNETQYTHILRHPHDKQMVFMATTNNKQPQAVFFKSLLHFSNLPTLVHMEMKLCVHMYFIVSMTTVQKCPQAHFPITTSSLLKLANHVMHGAETWYACIFEHFHDNHWQKFPHALFPVTTYFFTCQTCKPCNAWNWNLVRMCILPFP